METYKNVRKRNVSNQYKYTNLVLVFASKKARNIDREVENSS
jgi:hypothetical protein